MKQLLGQAIYDGYPYLPKTISKLLSVNFATDSKFLFNYGRTIAFPIENFTFCY